MAVPVPGDDPDHPDFDYDEFAYFEQNCAEYGLAPADGIEVERISHLLSDGRRLSALQWGTTSPRLVLVHGGAQNAHTWDTVALALRPESILAVDLAGHGHSDWRADRGYHPRSNAADLAAVLDELAPDAELVVGMSLGGLTVTSLAAARPDLVRRLVVVDVTPGVTRDKAAEVHAFIEGPQHFGTFDEIFSRTVEFNPTRSPESLKRGILHNAHRNDDGSWSWNHDRGLVAAAASTVDDASGPASAGHGDLWDDVSAVQAPFTLVRGSTSPVVDDDDVAELRRRQPGVDVLVVEGAGHSVQGDRPVELAQILADRLG